MHTGVEFKFESGSQIKALFSFNFRIAAYIRSLGGENPKESETSRTGSLDSEEIEYHFISGVSPPITSVTCVLCKSRIGDALKLQGLSIDFDKFIDLFKSPKLTGNGTLYFEKYRLALFPFDWYTCFESLVPGNRFEEIINILPSIPEIAKDLECMENIEKDREITEKQKKEEQRKQEEEQRREESRRKMEELVKTLEATRIQEAARNEEKKKAEIQRNLGRALAPEIKNLSTARKETDQEIFVREMEKLMKKK